MRFEIKGGGIAAIFLSVAVLSGAVFILGLLAGYDVGQQSQIDTAQLTTSYPLQTPTGSGSSSETMAATSPKSNPDASVSGTAQEPVGATRVANAQPTAGITSPPVRPPRTAAKPTRQRLASATIPPAAPPRSAAPPAPPEDDATADNAAGNDAAGEDLNQEVPAANNNPLRHHRPYNIQIQAAMDINGADAMMGRLRRLGYSAHLVPTEISGQRWYKVEVGPYATAEEASSAEAALRRRYDATYGGVARGNSSRPPAGVDDSEE